MRIIFSAFLALTLLCVPSFTIFQISPDAKVQAATLEQQKRALEAEAKRKAELAKQEEAKAARLEKAITQIQQDIKEVEGSLAGTEQAISDTQSKIAQQTQELAGHESTLRKLNDQLGALVRRMYIEAVAMKDEYAVLANRPVSDRERQEAQFIALKKSVAILHARTTEAKMVVERNRAELVAKNDQLSNLRDQQSYQKRSLASNKSYQEQLKDGAESAVVKYESEAKAARQKLAKIEDQIAAEAAAAAARWRRGGIPSGGVAGGVGSVVQRGQVLGRVGSTGFSTGPHLHFEVQRNGVAINPLPFFSNGTYMWPLSSFVITQGFGTTEFSGNYASGQHSGLDFGAPLGTPILASASGRLILHKYHPGYGYYKVVLLDNGDANLYAHMLP